MNFKREIAHIAGSIMVAVAALGIAAVLPYDLGWMVKWWVGTILAGVIICKEVMEDHVSQPRIKTIMDSLCWIVPYGLLVWLCR